MSPHQITVAIPGSGKELVLDTDPVTGRTSARVDGRAVMRPLAATEDEQEFSVGQRRYVLRRLDGGGFDVDITLPAPGAGGSSHTRDAAVPSKDKTSRSGAGTIIAGLFVLLAGGAVFFGGRALLRAIGDPIEITSFTCEAVGRDQFEAVVTLKNLSSDPLDLTGHITLIGIARSQIVPYQARVEPSPLAPEATGRLYIRDYKPASFNFASGDCRLDPFTDAAGKRLSYREAGRK